MFVFAERKHLIITHTLLFCNMTAIESFSSEKNYQAKGEIVNNKKWLVTIYKTKSNPI